MGVGSNDCRVSKSSDIVNGRGEKANLAPLNSDCDASADPDEPMEGELDDAGCFTEAYLNRVLPPIPDWMRKAPRPKEPSLFDEE